MILQTPKNNGKSCKELTQQLSMSPLAGSSGGISSCLMGSSILFLASGSSFNRKTELGINTAPDSPLAGGVRGHTTGGSHTYQEQH